MNPEYPNILIVYKHEQATGILFLFISLFGRAQELHRRRDELTASEWPKALNLSARTFILPKGSVVD